MMQGGSSTRITCRCSAARWSAAASSPQPKRASGARCAAAVPAAPTAGCAEAATVRVGEGLAGVDRLSGFGFGRTQ